MAWTEITRAKYRRDELRYASDTTDAEWAVIAAHLPAPGRARGRPRTTDLREVVDGIFYLAQSGCQWRLLPKDFRRSRPCRALSTGGATTGHGELVNHHLMMQAREAADQSLLHRA